MNKLLTGLVVCTLLAVSTMAKASDDGIREQAVAAVMQSQVLLNATAKLDLVRISLSDSSRGFAILLTYKDSADKLCAIMAEVDTPSDEDGRLVARSAKIISSTCAK